LCCSKVSGVASLELVADAVAAHLGQLDAQHDDRRLRVELARLVQALLAVANHGHFEAALAQVGGDVVGERLFGIDEQDRLRHG